jgi:CHAT domain-containing protein/tetratricopeptide (TPR) repeat protein
LFPAVAAALAFLAPRQPAGPTVLRSGVQVERTLGAKDTHEYQLALPAGESARLVVEQRGIDVVVRVESPHGALEFDDEQRPTAGETLVIVAEESPVRLAIEPAVGSATGQYAIHFTDVRPASPEDLARQDVQRLRTAARRLNSRQNSTDAAALLEQAVSIAERTASDPERDALVGLTLLDLGGVYINLRDHEREEQVLTRAETILGNTLGADHPRTALASMRLGLAYQQSGRRLEAEKRLQQALQTTERTLGPDHLQVASVLVPLGLVLEGAGDLEKAEAVERRAMRIVEKNGETDSLIYANLLNNLGTVYLSRRDFGRAGELFERTLALDERLGPDSYWVAVALQNLGIVARQQKDYARARDYYERSLAIRLKVLGPDHEEIAPILNNLALVYRDEGNIAKSIETHLRALAIWEKTSGPYSGGTMTSLGNLARTYAAIGDAAHALEYQRRADEVLEEQLSFNLAIGSERQKLAFVDNVSERTDRTISLHLDLAPGNANAAALAALVLLQRKGRVLDAMTDTIAPLRQHVADRREQELLDARGRTVARLAQLVLDGREKMPADEYVRTIKRLEEEKETIESALSEHSAEFRASSERVTLDAVQHAIPGDAVLVEYAVFRPFDPQASRNADAYGAPHYAAYVVRSSGSPEGIDLGDARRIDALVDRLRPALADPSRADVTALSRAVAQVILDPIRPLLAESGRLLIAPDGQLDLIPFEVLADARNHFLIEQYSITYLTSGRDLLRMRVPRPPGRGPIVLADPAFGPPATADAGANGSTSPRAGAGPPRDFPRLAGTAEEAREIQRLFPDVRVLTGGDATKGSLTQAHAPRMLHIASHGFFLGPASSPDAVPSGWNAGGAAANHPMLRSGIALAGANRPGASAGWGILTALEASNLDLWGTELVTLSACDTGGGTVRNGEGVYGLRRAFFLAGAETLVMSLWPVSDYVTRQIMTAFYTALKQGLGRGDALRRVQLAMMKRPGRRHPFYWASFIEAGDWNGLRHAR